MAMHNTNSLLKYGLPIFLIILLALWISSLFHHPEKKPIINDVPIKNTATHDSAAESLDTLTAELSETKKQITTVSKYNETLQKQYNDLIAKFNNQQDNEDSKIKLDLEQLKNQIQDLEKKTSAPTKNDFDKLIIKPFNNMGKKEEIKSIAYYTIPANATSVKDRLMTALVGRIPIKGVVTDPYPFKIAVSDDNLAANGLRIPHLVQMIVSGYCEGDLNLVSVRGWVTSLTFVFEDGTISTTTSNDNDIGNFTKSNSLGYLSDRYGNPFIRGKLITNAPAYLAGNAAISAATGAANAYAQSQVTNDASPFGNTSFVTGSATKYITGQGLSSSAAEVQQWWRDRMEQSFDAVYVAPTDEKGRFVEIAINFAKEIHIDYDPKGRKINYEPKKNLDRHLD